MNITHFTYLKASFFPPIALVLDLIWILFVSVQKSKHFLLCMGHEEGMGTAATWALQA